VRAVGFTRYGGPEVLGPVELPMPEPGEGEIRIRVTAATVNPSDTLFRSGGLAALMTGEWPYVAGLELAGIVDATGANGRWQVGDRVAAMTRFIPDGRGAHAELVVVHEDSAAAVPDGLALVEAATVPMNGLTVRLAYDTLGLSPGAVVAVSGAAGAVGGYATQVAVADGLRVIAIASPGDEELVASLGAEAMVPRGPDAAAAVRELVPDGVDALPAVRDGGRIVALRAFDGEPERGITIDLISVRTYIREPAKLQALLELAGTGLITPRVAAVYGFGEAAEAHRRLEAGGARGRLVLEPGAA
jgi:NADPH:quinone reductase-like Zn-dependent oxidoreductase